LDRKEVYKLIVHLAPLKVRTIVMDPVNNLGFSPLMKAALQGRIKCSKLLLFSGMLQCTHVLGAVYTCDFPYESPYDSVYDLLPKVSSKLIFDFF
jgi:hypothetical protein